MTGVGVVADHTLLIIAGDDVLTPRAGEDHILHTASEEGPILSLALPHTAGLQ